MIKINKENIMKLLTHYDLDGVSCAILLQSFIKNLDVKAIGYNSLNETFDEFIFKNKACIITDISLDDMHVNNMFLSKNKILYIDHHQTSLPHKDKSDNNVKIYINEKYCAAANVLKYFKDKQKFSPEMKQLVYLTNDYDMWYLKEVESQILNYIFWSRKFNAFTDMFKNGYNGKIVDSFRAQFQVDQDKIKKYIDGCDQFDIELNDRKILLIFASEHTGAITINKPGYDFYFIVSNKYKISVRSDMKYDMTKAFESLNGSRGIDSVGGHKNAGGINIAASVFNNSNELMDFYYDLIEHIVTESK